MTFTQLLDELKTRSEKIKQEVLEEVVKSKTLNRIISNENFIRAVSTVISTKREVKKVLNKQIKSLIKTMEVVTHSDLSKLVQQLKNLEAGIEDVLKENFWNGNAKPKAKAKSKTKAKGKKPAKAAAKAKPAQVSAKKKGKMKPAKKK